MASATATPPVHDSINDKVAQTIETLMLHNGQHQIHIAACFTRLREVMHQAMSTLPPNLIGEIEQAQRDITNSFLQTINITQNLTQSLIVHQHATTNRYREQFGYWPAARATGTSRAALLHLARYGPATNDTDFGALTMNPFVNNSQVTPFTPSKPAKKTRAKKTASRPAKTTAAAPTPPPNQFTVPTEQADEEHNALLNTMIDEALVDILNADSDESQDDPDAAEYDNLLGGGNDLSDGEIE